MNKRVDEQDVQKHVEDYYLTILCGTSIFRLSKPRHVNDIIVGVRAFHKSTNSANALNRPEDYEVFYKGLQIIGSLQGAGIPSGARIEVKTKIQFN